MKYLLLVLMMWSVPSWADSFTCTGFSNYNKADPTWVQNGWLRGNYVDGDSPKLTNVTLATQTRHGKPRVAEKLITVKAESLNLSSHYVAPSPRYINYNGFLINGDTYLVFPKNFVKKLRTTGPQILVYRPSLHLPNILLNCHPL